MSQTDFLSPHPALQSKTLRIKVHRSLGSLNSEQDADERHHIHFPPTLPVLTEPELGIGTCKQHNHKQGPLSGAYLWKRKIFDFSVISRKKMGKGEEWRKALGRVGWWT